MDKYDTSQLTEFPRFEPESSQSGVSTFLNKLWKLPLFTPSDGSEGLKSIEDGKDSSHGNSEAMRRESVESKTETGAYAVELEGRSLPNVLRRISSLIALGSGSGTRYADTELARYWMPDDISRECYECAARFSTLRRRHHCRVCGQIFCSRCCSQRVPGHIFGCAGGLRVCNYCCNVVLSYLKENDLNGEISPDLRTLQENLQVKFPENKSSSSDSRENFVFAHDQEERGETRGAASESLPDIYRQLAYTLPTHQHRYRLVRYSGVWRGADILQWVMDNTTHKTRVQATSIGQSLVSSGYVECVTDISHFADYALYRPCGASLTQDSNIDASEPEETRFVESVSSYCLDLNLGENSARLIKTPKADVSETKSTSNDDDLPFIDQNEDDCEQPQVCPNISAWGAEHLRVLLRQLLAAAALPPAWHQVLLPLCQQAADVILPEADSKDIDVRNYVQVKKVPGGAPRDSCLIRGVVLTKNVAHRGMPQQISNPTILLLDCSIAYQRVEGKLTSLEPVLLQEHEYLSRMGARLGALGARVVLARGGAGRAVCAAAVQGRAALALRVRRPALRRVARATAAHLVASLDARIGSPRLGTADNFYLKDFGTKTLMILEGCANPHLGCCILLRGPAPELIRVKKVVKFMLLACYNWKLEKAFYADIEAMLPEPGMAFEDDTSERDNFLSDKNTDEVNVLDDSKNTGDVTYVPEDSKISESTELDENDLKTGKTTLENDSKGGENAGQGISKDDETHKDIKNSTDSKNTVETKKDDPLQKPKSSRKTENLSCGVPIRDFSDPLRSNLSVDDDVFLPKEEATLVADTQNERWSPDDVVLSISPSVVVSPPYLECEGGRRCGLRRCFPSPLLCAPAPRTPAPAHSPLTGHRGNNHNTVKEYHPFVKMAMKSSADDLAIKAALAHYRATGCRVNTKEHEKSCPQYKLEVVKPTKPPEPEVKEEPLDPFAPENHQKFHLLIYSYSNKSPNVPDFCVNPWIMTMESYGSHDITLGAFLDKYCFNSHHPCSSDTCHVPINQHIRKFVHNDVCITITCNTIGHSSVDKSKEEGKHVTFWSRCSVCGAGGAARRMSRAALRLSLAGYVRLRTSSGRPLAARCVHPLHAHTHAFTRHLTTACFAAIRMSRAALRLSLTRYVRLRISGGLPLGVRIRCMRTRMPSLDTSLPLVLRIFYRYNKISTYDIMLPPDVISTNYDTKQMRDSLIEQLNELMHKGHEVMSNCGTGSEQDLASFRHHMDTLHVALSAPALRENNTDAVVRSLWSISDGIIIGEKMIRDAQEKWSSPPAKTKQQMETVAEDKSDSDDGSSESSINEGTTYVFTDNQGREIEKEHAGPDEDEEKGDKKTIKQILSQLLSSNQSANQAGMIVLGAVCVCVYAHQTGSVIAAALAAQQARMHCRGRHTGQHEQEEAENTTNKDKTDGDKSKTSKSSEHVEIMLKDGLVCRIYYASQFAALRHAVIAPLSANEECCCDGDKKLCSIEEGYIRSLAHCVPWATRGGKSGSTFCKTKDDRYVLKEMTKPEWQQFLEFAPHYFNYVNACRQKQVPSLLARMVGVYSVGGAGGAGGGVLVLENVWYATATQQRYDLKGSSRHRLAPLLPAAECAAPPPPTYNVLMDENLLNLRWEHPLYIRTHAGRVLSASLHRDTAFLAAHDVMDYSLLLAINNQQNTLVLGVIDYIRTFTWDKKLEHLVKKNLGSGQPTVVSPEQYKKRFCDATRKYFLQCPEHWDHLYNVLPTLNTIN